MSNCLFEAAFENILSKCKCAPGNSFFSAFSSWKKGEGRLLYSKCHKAGENIIGGFKM